jgi:GPN-loop GTPase
VDDFFKAVNEAREEYYKEYIPELERAVAQRESKLEKKKKEHIQRAMEDMKLDGNLDDEGWARDDDDDAMFDADGIHFPRLYTDFSHSGLDEEPGHFIDVTQMRRGNQESTTWPKPG